MVLSYPIYYWYFPPRLFPPARDSFPAPRDAAPVFPPRDTAPVLGAGVGFDSGTTALSAN